MNKYDQKHQRNIAAYQRMVERIYKQAAADIALRSQSLSVPDEGMFSFSDYPLTQQMMDQLIARMRSDLTAVVTDGVKEEWDLSNAKNDALATSALGMTERLPQYFQRNEEARDAFLARKEGGLTISDRVWRYTEQFKGEIEMGLDCGIRDGLDAWQMGRRLQQYLQHPDKLFRRVRDEHGMLQLSKAAAQYHPGQGVYRSSYKNARRLAATETNIAYRTADYERWQQFDFIVGIEIHLSNNHTCLGKDGKPHPFHDICDELKGKYPKDFKFTGWHPHCRCIATTILKTKEELDADDERVMNGEQPSDPSTSANAVNELPDNFKQWVEDNEERIARAKSFPYFLQDNASLIARETSSYSSSNMFTGYIRSKFNTIVDKLSKPEVSEQQAMELLNEVVAANPMLIRGNFGGFVIDRTSPEGNFMRTETIGHGKERKIVIHISNNSHTVIGVDGKPIKFNPLREVQGAFASIIKGQEFTISQEYALESVWHELRHGKAIGWRSFKVAEENPQLVIAMEIINQFCARVSYPTLLTQLGAKASHLAEILKGGYGYHVEVGNFIELLSHFGISKEDAFKHFERKIIESDYDGMYNALGKFLKGKGIKDAEKFVSALCESPETFAFLMGG